MVKPSLLSDICLLSVFVCRPVNKKLISNEHCFWKAVYIKYSMEANWCHLCENVKY